MLRALKLALVLFAAAFALAPPPRALVERTYSSRVYPLVQPALTGLSNRTSFALFDGVVLGVAALLITMWLVRWRLRKRGAIRTLAALLFDTAAIAAVIYLWFLIGWGWNYHRQPLRARVEFDASRVTHDGLRVLAERMVESLNALYDRAHAEGWPELAATPLVLHDAFIETQRDLTLDWRVLPARTKRSLFDFYFTRVSVDGMTDPFFLETLANQTLLPFERPATVAHEWAHLAGFADESEANFVGWLVCMRGPAAVQYSGWLALHGTIMGGLTRDERQEIGRSLGEGPRRDLRAAVERVQRYAMPAVSRAGYAMYDRFLKANRVESGIRSYGEVVQLMLGTRFDENGAPVMRREGNE